MSGFRFFSILMVLEAMFSVGFVGCSKMGGNRFKVPHGAYAPYDKATEEEVREIEVGRHIRLPEDYRQFLLQVNGIRMADELSQLVFSLRDPKGGTIRKFDVYELYTVSKNAKEVDRILERQHDYHFDVRVPNRFLLIGRTSGPEQICISLSGPDCGAVYYWSAPDVPSWEEAERNSEEWLTFLAPNFSEYWSLLRLWQPESLKRADSVDEQI